jgi:acyl-CoA reductase-like NAD-dependent aldehyde dehydrogenase
VRDYADELATVITREQGKPLSNSQREVAGTANTLEAMANIKVKDQLLRNDGKNLISLHFRPMGVVGAITPWNVPLGLAAHKITQALLAGNTMVLKPSPYTPVATLLLGEMSRDILPPGVLNVLAGGNDLGQRLVEHAGVDRISFTGSVATGKRVMSSASGTLKRVTLELGGNDPAIVLDDADLDAVTPKIFGAAFANCGQICMAIKRLYVPEHRYDQVCESLSGMAKAYRVGDGFDADVQMGPLQNKMQYDKVLDVLDDTKRQPGVRILTGGHTLNLPGYFLAPTIVADIADDSRLVREEQFGPILPVLKYKEIDDAVARANDTRMGLCASVWTGDVEKGAAVAARLEAGTVWINHHLGSEADIPFGGFKESGLGREHGIMGVQSYMEPQVINLPAAPAA